MLDYRPVSKSKNRQKLDITPLCCQAKSKTMQWLLKVTQGHQQWCHSTSINLYNIYHQQQWKVTCRWCLEVVQGCSWTDGGQWDQRGLRSLQADLPVCSQTHPADSTASNYQSPTNNDYQSTINDYQSPTNYQSPTIIDYQSRMINDYQSPTISAIRLSEQHMCVQEEMQMQQTTVI